MWAKKNSKRLSMLPSRLMMIHFFDQFYPVLNVDKKIKINSVHDIEGKMFLEIEGNIL